MLKENVLLKEYTTMKTGGYARYFFYAKKTEDIKSAVVFAKEKKIPIFILGGGSNTIFSDKGFKGVVIKMEIDGVSFEEIDDKKVRVIAGAGVEWDKLVEETVNKNLYGLENLSLIPGTVGAAPVQNIGAYGVEVGDVIEWVEVMNTETMEVKKMTNKECEFGYRDSVFKTKEGEKFIILNVAFDLKKEAKLKTDYKDLQEYFSTKGIEPTLKNLRDAIIETRTSKLPDFKKVGNAGSFFENPVVSQEKLRSLLKKYPELKYFEIDGGLVKLSAAWLIDKVGKWRGACIGDACVYEEQALVLVNKGKASSEEVIYLANKIVKDIKQKTGIELTVEVNIINAK